MEKNTKPRRCWYRFSLRTMLVTVMCIYLGWAMNWMRQRDNFLMSYEEWNVVTKNDPRFYKTGPPPLALRILGARGFVVIGLDWETEEEVIAIRDLFPEAHIDLFKGGFPRIHQVIEAGSEYP